jgi:hypothetical protein
VSWLDGQREDEAEEPRRSAVIVVTAASFSAFPIEQQWFVPGPDVRAHLRAFRYDPADTDGIWREQRGPR